MKGGREEEERRERRLPPIHYHLVLAGYTTTIS